MSADKTGIELSQITDAGEFERLATAVLREANIDYGRLVHTGVNAEGKTVKSPLDGICYILNANPRHLVAVHHATGPSIKLKHKWLNDPLKVKTKKNTKPTAPEGDVIKTLKIIKDERSNDPSLLATLVLTSNSEPPENLVRKVNNLASEFKLNIDIWSRSRISHFLDNKPEGQWIRSNFLGDRQLLLSRSLLSKISKKNIESFYLLSNEKSWIDRQLESSLSLPLNNGGIFLTAESGHGKSVVCYRLLNQHIINGGFGVVLTPEIIKISNSVEQAINLLIEQYYPKLSTSSPSPLKYCSELSPFLIIVEDINQSNQSSQMARKILSWLLSLSKEEKHLWNLVCPIWPENISALNIQEQQSLAPFAFSIPSFNEAESTEAILTRAKIENISLSSLEAKEISQNLGNDPLLIGLYSFETDSSSRDVIHDYVNNSISLTLSEFNEFTKVDYLNSLQFLGKGMLKYLLLEPSWEEITQWDSCTNYIRSALSNLIKTARLISLPADINDTKIIFRHDRIKYWILRDAVINMLAKDELSNEIVSNPYYSEIVGNALVSSISNKEFVKVVSKNNPLALFYAFHCVAEQSHPLKELIIDELKKWLDEKTSHETQNDHLRWHALLILAKTTSSEVLLIINKFKDKNWSYHFARLRNGDFNAAIDICSKMELGVTAVWMDQQLNHAINHYYQNLMQFIVDKLSQTKLQTNTKIGLLRLAGYLADDSLGKSIEKCWLSDKNKNEAILDYFWAFAQCCGDLAEQYLQPICDYWLSLSGKENKNNHPSERDSFVSHQIRFAFHKKPPVNAIKYLVQRAADKDLEWPIVYLLNGVNHPIAIKFIVNYLASIRIKLEGSDNFSPFVMLAKDVWRRVNEGNHPMSKSSKKTLEMIWRNEEEDKYTRLSAYEIWDTSRASSDLELLNLYLKDKIISEQVLISRLLLGDIGAIDDLIKKIGENGNTEYWWQYCKNVWSDKLTSYLDVFLNKQISKSKLDWGEGLGDDFLTSELVQDLPTNDAEKILLKYWENLKYSPRFLQSALYIATPKLLDLADIAMKECSAPKKMMEHLSSNIGYKTNNRSGLTNKNQFLAFAKYSQYFSEYEVSTLSDMCNERGWYVERKEYLDGTYKDMHKGNRSYNITSLINTLNNALKEDSFCRVDYHIDSVLNFGISWKDIISNMFTWLEKNRTIYALELICESIIDYGNRSDLIQLETYKNDAINGFNERIDDTIFAVKRKSNC